MLDFDIFQMTNTKRVKAKSLISEIFWPFIYPIKEDSANLTRFTTCVCIRDLHFKRFERLKAITLAHRWSFCVLLYLKENVSSPFVATTLKTLIFPSHQNHAEPNISMSKITTWKISMPRFPHISGGQGAMKGPNTYFDAAIVVHDSHLSKLYLATPPSSKPLKNARHRI